MDPSAHITERGGDAYEITSQRPFNDIESTQKRTLDEARSFCSSLKREFFMVSIASKFDYMPVVITFKCLNAVNRAPTVYLKTPETLTSLKYNAG
jgi:hypothetical protein